MTSNIDIVPRRLRAETKTTTKSTHKAQLSGATIRRLFAIPSNATIKVTVPSGGDWSR